MFETSLEARILIVDDEPANVRLLQRILQREGFRNIEATHDPHQFLALFASHAPDIIMLDLHMPGVDGFTLMAQLRERIPEGDVVPIVVLTADVTPEARQRALRSGAKDFLTKPVDPIEVVLRINALYHHENWDGSGYLGHTGERIPLRPKADWRSTGLHPPRRPFPERWSGEERGAPPAPPTRRHESTMHPPSTRRRARTRPPDRPARAPQAIKGRVT
jgi:CheY-like chemotaxis protein